DQRPTLAACSGGGGRRASLALGTAAAAGCQDSDDHSHRPEHRRALQTNHPLSVSRSRYSPCHSDGWRRAMLAPARSPGRWWSRVAIERMFAYALGMQLRLDAADRLV